MMLHARPMNKIRVTIRLDMHRFISGILNSSKQQTYEVRSSKAKFQTTRQG
ncbi:hypothetical protein OIU76_014885 [Salix suchowensis]|nr:hypothetical protein OIU76_014885 [Salix suchowensis]